MARFVSILPKDGLMEWECDHNRRKCALFSHLAYIEDDNGNIRTSPVMYWDSIVGDSADSILESDKDEKVKIVEYVNEKDFLEYVKTEEAECGCGILQNIIFVLDLMTKAKVRIDKELIDKLAQLDAILQKIG